MNEKKKLIAINLYSGLACTLHANPGVHAAYNIIDTPPRFRQTAVLVINPLNRNGDGRLTESRDIRALRLK